MNREAIYSALYAQLQTVLGFQTVSRRMRHPSSVTVAEMPALFIAERKETPRTKTGQPTEWQIDVELFIYVDSGGDPNISGTTVLNTLIDAVIATLSPNVMANKFDLGGLAHYVRVEGPIDINEGSFGNFAIAAIPVQILAPV